MARNELERYYTYTDDYFQYIYNEVEVLSFQIWATEQVKWTLEGAY